MITRYALFEGKLKEGSSEAFRHDVLEIILPKWRAFPGALNVRVCFTETHDEGSPEFPLILAIDYPDLAAVDAALASPVRGESREATMLVLARHFEGRIHHHVTTAHTFST